MKNQVCVVRSITMMLPDEFNGWRNTPVASDNVFQSVTEMKRWYRNTDLPQMNRDKDSGVVVLFGYIKDDEIYWTAKVTERPNQVIEKALDVTEVKFEDAVYR